LPPHTPARNGDADQDSGTAQQGSALRDGGSEVGRAGRAAAAVLREAASAVEGADLAEVASGGRGAIVAALERIAAACPGTLAVSVRPAMRPDMRPDTRPAGGAPGVPPGPSPAGLALNEDVELPLASVGKLLLLAEVAMSVDGGILDPDEPVPVHDDDYCGGSGLLLGLSARAWTVGDLALLTAAVSDNTATNALLRRIGLDRVNAAGAALGLTRTRLLDRIREPRGPGHPATFAIGTAGELAGLAGRLAGPDGWQVLMREWMLANTDHGLVPALMWHDPEGTRIANKTGTDDGIRTDVGLMGPLAYAVLAGGPPGSDQHLAHAVRQAGALLATAAHL
uniref:serine hydrolase n=1 Tax=Nonomuraea sp. SBT364 TaxID=1580530 RepID=UPI000AFB4254